MYDAFGSVVSQSGSSANNRLANTKERDVSLGLDNHGFRYYDPEVGSYTTRDPIGYAAGTLNVYAYADSNPVNTYDPLGLRNKIDVDEDKKVINITVPLRFQFRNADKSVVKKPTKEMKKMADSLAAAMGERWSGHKYGEYTVNVNIKVDYYEEGPEGKSSVFEGGYNAVYLFMNTEAPFGNTRRSKHETVDTRNLDFPVDEPVDRYMAMNVLTSDDYRQLLTRGGDKGSISADSMDRILATQGTIGIHEFGHILGLGDEYLRTDFGTKRNPNAPANSLYNVNKNDPAKNVPFGPAFIYPYHIRRILAASRSSAVQKVVRGQKDWAATGKPRFAGYQGTVGFESQRREGK